MKLPNTILVIQTSFIGDVILATSVLETLHAAFPDAQIDALVKKGNEPLLKDHPFVRNTLVWNKGGKKYGDLLRLMQKIRANKYDVVVNLHRFASSGALVAYSDAPIKLGFRKNPMSRLFTHTAVHSFDGVHEIERNARVISTLIGDQPVLPPRLYPSAADASAIKAYTATPYRCIAPSSVWFTKQWPAAKWIELMDAFPHDESIYLLGATEDKGLCASLMQKTAHPGVTNLAGKLSLLQSAALMKGATMNYVNDSAPLHLASAMNAPVRAIFCSTVPQFGFGPLSEDAKIIETKEALDCRPCGLHGHAECPKQHFKCATTISIDEIVKDA